MYLYNTVDSPLPNNSPLPPKRSLRTVPPGGAQLSKVTSLRAALRAEFWSHRNSTFWEPQCRPQSFRSLVGLLCAPILVTRFASRVRAPVSESLCGPQNWTHAQYYIRMRSAYMPCLGQGQILQCRAMSQQATRELLV